MNEYIHQYSNIECDNHQNIIPINKNLDTLYENVFYEEALLEIEEDRKIKSTWAKALSHTDGDEAKHWYYSSARDYEDIQGLIEVERFW